jgi:hypothetical protein
LAIVKPLEQTYALSLSETHEFLFNISGIPAPKFKWIKDNKELPLKDRVKFTCDYKDDIYECKLILTGVQASDAGVYKVEASNKCSTINTQFTVGVQGGPIFVRKPADLNVVEKKPFKVDCEVTGLPLPTVEW